MEFKKHTDKLIDNDLTFLIIKLFCTLIFVLWRRNFHTSINTTKLNTY